MNTSPWRHAVRTARSPCVLLAHAPVGIALRCGDADAIAAGVVGPSVKEAGPALRVAARLAHHHGVAVRATVDERADDAVVAADDDDRGCRSDPACGSRRALGISLSWTGEPPGPPLEQLLLGVEQRRIGVDVRADVVFAGQGRGAGPLRTRFVPLQYVAPLAGVGGHRFSCRHVRRLLLSPPTFGQKGADDTEASPHDTQVSSASPRARAAVANAGTVYEITVQFYTVAIDGRRAMSGIVS